MSTKKLSSLDQLRNDDRNANRGTARGAQILDDSISELGLGRSILVDKYGSAIAGNKTLEAARRAGITKIRVVETAGDELVIVQRTDLDLKRHAKAKKLAIVDNRASELSLEWDPEVLGALAQELDLEKLFDVDELSAIIARGETQEAEYGDVDEVPELPKKPKTKLGDLYELGEHLLVCGDSTDPAVVDRILQGKPANLVFTDPPYGIAYHVKGASSVATETSSARQAMRGRAKIASDGSLAVAGKLAQDALTLQKGAGAYFVCCDWKSYPTMRAAMEANGLDLKAVIVWDKGGPYQHLDRFAKGHEFICYAGPFGSQETKATDVWKIPREFRDDHPTPKPVELVKQALESASNRGDIVVDCFAGSGSTLIACEVTGRRGRMVELDPAYCDVIVQRWQDLTGISPKRTR